jgi:hypothetical protein
MRQRAASQLIQYFFSHYFVPVFTNFLSCSSSFYCFVEKSIRVDLRRQGSQFHANINMLDTSVSYMALIWPNV